jgi:hypothetical protein
MLTVRDCTTDSGKRPARGALRASLDGSSGWRYLLLLKSTVRRSGGLSVSFRIAIGECQQRGRWLDTSLADVAQERLFGRAKRLPIPLDFAAIGRSPLDDPLHVGSTFDDAPATG